MRKGGGGVRPSPAGLFASTCTCQKSGGMTQSGYPTPCTMIYVQVHPEPNSAPAWEHVGVGAEGKKKSKDKETKPSQIDKCWVEKTQVDALNTNSMLTIVGSLYNQTDGKMQLIQTVCNPFSIIDTFLQ